MQKLTIQITQNFRIDNSNTLIFEEDYENAMEYFIICLVAMLGAGLTLFSGFGLGTILLPVFGLFFPIEIAVVLTALVHFMNNAFKLLLLGRNADKNTVMKFGIPAILFSFLGAYALSLLTDIPPFFSYHINNTQFEVKPLKLIIGLLLIVFALFDVIPQLKNLEFDKKHLPLGGALSGFFGGISGHQGALRSAFLIRTGLSKEAFIATGVVIACLVDVSRLSIYIPKIISNEVELDFKLVGLATLSAFMGVYFGNKLLQKTTITLVQNIVGVTLLVFGILMMTGIV